MRTRTRSPWVGVPGQEGRGRSSCPESEGHARRAVPGRPCPEGEGRARNLRIRGAVTGIYPSGGGDRNLRIRTEERGGPRSGVQGAAREMYRSTESRLFVGRNARFGSTVGRTGRRRPRAPVAPPGRCLGVLRGSCHSPSCLDRAQTSPGRARNLRIRTTERLGPRASMHETAPEMYRATGRDPFFGRDARFGGTAAGRRHGAATGDGRGAARSGTATAADKRLRRQRPVAGQTRPTRATLSGASPRGARRPISRCGARGSHRSWRTSPA